MRILDDDDIALARANSSKNKKWLKQYLEAGDARTPLPVLVALGYSEDARIRRRVAENPSTPEHVLRLLARDETAEVRLGLCDNPAAPEWAIGGLAADSDPNVRFQLAENPRMPPSLLVLLSEDENPYVASRALKTLAASPDRFAVGHRPW